MKDEILEQLADLIRKIELSIADTPWALRPADECYHMAEKLITHGVTIQEWVPVKEQLPDDSRSVILCTRSRIVGIGFYDKTTRKWVQHYSGGGIYVDVTHWMPLPEPPKGKINYELSF